MPNKYPNGKTDLEKGRISNSRSGFSGDYFLLVFKTKEGTYTPPVKIPRLDALSIAKDFHAHSELVSQYGITVEVASFIKAKAVRRGLIAAPETDSELSLADFSTDSVESIDSVNDASEPNSKGSAGDSHARKPKHLPEIDAYVTPQFSAEVVKRLAYILSGVDPNYQSSSASGPATIRQLMQIPLARVSPGIVMQDDHWYILFHLHHLDRDAFKTAWEEGQLQATGQANTDVVKLMASLEKFKIDATASCLDEVSNKAFFQAIQDKSIELLSRIFRRIRRKVESVYEQPEVAPPRKNLLESLFKKRNDSSQHTAPVQPEINELVVEYLNQVTKIGRILRSEVLQSKR